MRRNVQYVQYRQAKKEKSMQLSETAGYVALSALIFR